MFCVVLTTQSISGANSFQQAAWQSLPEMSVLSFAQYLQFDAFERDLRFRAVPKISRA
jgi:hypothetical protein